MPDLTLTTIFYAFSIAVSIGFVACAVGFYLLYKLKSKSVVHVEPMRVVLNTVDSKYPAVKDALFIDTISKGKDDGDLRVDLDNGNTEPNYRSYKLIEILFSEDGWGRSPQTAARIGNAYRLLDKADELLGAFNLYTTTLSLTDRMSAQHYFNIMFAALTDGITPSQAIRVEQLMRIESSVLEPTEEETPPKKKNGATELQTFEGGKSVRVGGG